MITEPFFYIVNSSLPSASSCATSTCSLVEDGPDLTFWFQTLVIFTITEELSIGPHSTETLIETSSDGFSFPVNASQGLFQFPGPSGSVFTGYYMTISSTSCGVEVRISTHIDELGFG